MDAAQYAVRINSREGALEVVGPDKEWVDAKIEQLSSVLTEYRPQDDADGGGTRSGRQKAPARRKRAAALAATDDADGTKSATRRSRGGGGRAEINPELVEKLTPEVKTKLREYVDARSKAWAASQSAQAAIVATFLYDEIGWTGIDPHDLYTIYSTMGEKIPRNLRAVLVNARQRARYFGNVSGGKAILSHNGENFARHDSIKAEDDDE
jgi:hypothetical protein